MDINHLDYVELDKLKSEIEQRLLSMAKKEKRNAMQKVLDIARQYGLDSSDLNKIADQMGSTKKKRSKVEPRYAHPDNSSLTWTGRGRSPQWVTDWKNSGRSLDACLIKH
jgi:DNA-binding protein H-NS